jgi:hypothetical protein
MEVLVVAVAKVGVEREVLGPGGKCVVENAGVKGVFIDETTIRLPEPIIVPVPIAIMRVDRSFHEEGSCKADDRYEGEEETLHGSMRCYLIFKISQ